ASAKAFGHPLFVRLMHEMNDSTYPWGVGVNGNEGPEQYVSAWKHVVDIFRSEGATKVNFVWCIATNRVQPDPTTFYPGDAYVSWIALDGYNKGHPWRSFTTAFSRGYDAVTRLSDRPVMIAETASVEDPANPTAKAS